jgi:hypothetical protein
MVFQSLILLAVQCQTSALEWSAPPRRDVGRIQATIGDGETRVFPRRELTAVSADSFLAGPGRPVAGFDLAQGPGRVPGASVPFASPTENMPPAAITPLPPDYRNELPGAQPPPVPRAAPAPPAAVPTPVPVVPPTPAVAAIPAAPLQVAAPPQIVQPIPVFFQTPTTGSSFIPAGAAGPIAAPGGAVLSPAPMVAAPVGTGLQLAPTAGPAPGLIGVQQGTGFLSESGATLERFQLRPRMPSKVASPPPAAPGLVAPPSVPEPTIPMPAAPSPPAARPRSPEPPQNRPLERLEIPEAPPAAADPLPNLDGPSPLPAIP